MHIEETHIEENCITNSTPHSTFNSTHRNCLHKYNPEELNCVYVCGHNKIAELISQKIVEQIPLHIQLHTQKLQQLAASTHTTHNSQQPPHIQHTATQLATHSTERAKHNLINYQRFHSLALSNQLIGFESARRRYQQLDGEMEVVKIARRGGLLFFDSAEI